MIVNPVAITLQDPLEIAQEPSDTFPFPAHPKVEHHALRPDDAEG